MRKTVRGTVTDRAPYVHADDLAENHAQEIINMLNDDAPIKEIAWRYRCAEWTVRRAMRKIGKWVFVPYDQ